jgi:hypothetical protein
MRTLSIISLMRPPMRTVILGVKHLAQKGEHSDARVPMHFVMTRCKRVTNARSFLVIVWKTDTPR